MGLFELLGLGRDVLGNIVGLKLLQKSSRL